MSTGTVAAMGITEVVLIVMAVAVLVVVPLAVLIGLWVWQRRQSPPA